VRAFDARGQATDLDLIRAAEWVLAPTDLAGRNPRADLAPDIVNCSWVLENGADPLLDPVLAAWRAAGILPVFAAGNADEDTERPGSLLAPAGEAGVLAVGATTAVGEVWERSLGGPSFSGSPKPDLAAPGEAVPSAGPDGGIVAGTGTSMAAPHVTGAAALLLGLDPDLGIDDLANLLRVTARDLPPPGRDDRSGHGQLDAYAAARLALSAGRLAGRVTAEDGAPIAGALVTARSTSEEEGTPWLVRATATGDYSVTVPAGETSVDVAAFGWVTRSLHVGVVSGRTTRLEAVLAPLPAGEVRGQVRGVSGRPLPGAVITVGDTDRRTVADASGNYRLVLPSGAHRLQFHSPGYRIADVTLHVQTGGRLRHDIDLARAPELLVVDADAYLGERIHPYLTRALDDAGYGYARRP
jgi:hypothetical protein